MREQDTLALDAGEAGTAGDTDPPSRRGPGRRFGGWVLLAVAVAASALVVSHDDLTVDWFSDEMWRVAMIRSPDWWSLYLSWDTPTPPGFLSFFRVVDVVLPTGPLALRLWVLGGLVVAMLLTARLLLAIVDRPPLAAPWDRGRPISGRHEPGDGSPSADARAPARRRSMQIAAVATVVVLPLLEAYGVHRIFVQYVFELVLATAIVLAVERIDHDDRWWPLLLGLIVVTPLLAIGTMFVLPAAVVYAGLWARRRTDGTRRLTQLGGATAASAIAALVVWLVAYRPVVGESITFFWSPWSLDGDASAAPRLLGDTLRQLRFDIVGWSQPNAIASAPTLVFVVLAVCAGVGLVSLGRRWPPLIVFMASSWLLVVVASYLQAWPMTPERVNLAVFSPLYAVTVFGALRAVSVIARESVPVIVAACLAVGVLSWPNHETGLFGDAFLRGLTSDLDVVAASPAQENWVVTYHFASRWYAEDVLVTSPPGGRSYDLFAQTYTEFRMYSPDVMAERIAALEPGTAVWCVIPYDIGPSATDEACIVPDDLTWFYDEHHDRAQILGYVAGCAELAVGDDVIPDDLLRACEGTFVPDV